MAKELDDKRVRYFIGDVRDKERLNRAFDGVDYIIHAAALKQVVALEYNPAEAIKTNIIGTQNVINCALDKKIKRVLFISTDKAVEPTNLYGATKMCAEKLILASNVYAVNGSTKLSVVRYGNIVGSRGSVSELFANQVAHGNITLTDKGMTRFWFNISDAVDFVLKSLVLMNGNEVFIPKIPKKRIMDIANDIIREHPHCKITTIGMRKGEKMHETLISEYESLYAEDKEDYYMLGEKIMRSYEDSFVYNSIC